MANYVIVHGDELYHYGVLGMKWGVRNYQTKDGKLTDAGRERYGYSKKELKKAIKTAKKEYGKGDSHDVFRRIRNRGMTGENYAKVHKNFQKSVNNDAKLQSLDRQLVRAERNAERVTQIQELFSDNPGLNYYDLKVMDLNSKFSKRKEEIADRYTKKFQEAMLKDIGYQDIDLGMQMLKEYGIGTGRRSRNVDFVTEDIETYKRYR